MQITDFRYPHLSITLTSEQKRFLIEIIKKYHSNLRIFRNSISLKRFTQISKRLSQNDMANLKKIFGTVRIRTGHSMIALIPFEFNITPGLCELYGFLTGDGSMLEVCRFYNSQPTIISRINSLLERFFKLRLKFERRTDYFIPKTVQIIIEEIFGRKGLSKHAHVPKVMYTLPLGCIKNYIRALFDTDGTVGKNLPTLASRSPKLIEGIRALLKERFNIESHIRKDGIDYQLVIGTGRKCDSFPNLLRFYEDINFLHLEKARILSKRIMKRKLYHVLNSVRNGLPTSKEISLHLNTNLSAVIEHLNNLNSWEFVNKIKAPNGNKFLWTARH